MTPEDSSSVKSASAKKPVISIYIPTYNRADYLGALMTTLEKELKTCGDGVEIVVSDNSESLDSYQACLSQKIPIRYHRNGQNLGADRNFAQLTELCTGEFIWTIGDDDQVKDGAVRAVLNLASKLSARPDVGLIALNYEVHTKDGKIARRQKVRPAFSGTVPPVACIESLGLELMTMSALVFRRSSIEGDFGAHYMVGTSISPLIFSLRALSRHSAWVEVEPLVVHLDANQESWSRHWPGMKDILGPTVLYRALRSHGLSPKQSRQFYLPLGRFRRLALSAIPKLHPIDLFPLCVELASRRIIVGTLRSIVVKLLKRFSSRVA